MVDLQPDLILAFGTPVTAALQRETRTIPIVFVIVSDHVGDGFVASLARPGGNITGFHNSEGRWAVSGWSTLRGGPPRFGQSRAGVSHPHKQSVAFGNFFNLVLDRAVEDIDYGLRFYDLHARIFRFSAFERTCNLFCKYASLDKALACSLQFFNMLIGHSDAPSVGARVT